MTYFVYMVRCADGSHYTGLCTDPKKRMREHRERTAACAKYTRSHPAVALDALWQAESRSDAARLEALIKRLPKQKKLALIEHPETLGAVFGEKLRATAYQSVPRAVFMQYFPPASNTESGSERKK